MSPLSVENIIFLKFALLKTGIGSWFVLFSASTMADKILSFIKVVSFRPAGEIFMH